MLTIVCRRHSLNRTLRQYRIILSADTASEVRQMLSQKRIIVVQGSCFRILAAGRQPQQQADSRRAQHSQRFGRIVYLISIPLPVKTAEKKGRRSCAHPILRTSAASWSSFGFFILRFADVRVNVDGFYRETKKRRRQNASSAPKFSAVGKHRGRKCITAILLPQGRASRRRSR